MPSTVTTTVAGRIPNEHAHQIEALARRNGTTTSSIVAQIISERFTTPEQADHLPHTIDDLRPDSDPSNTKQGVGGQVKVAAMAGVDRGGTVCLSPLPKSRKVDATGTGR